MGEQGAFIAKKLHMNTAPPPDISHSIIYKTKISLPTGKPVCTHHTEGPGIIFSWPYKARSSRNYRSF